MLCYVVSGNVFGIASTVRIWFCVYVYVYVQLLQSVR